MTVADGIPIELQVHSSAVASSVRPNPTNDLPRWLLTSLRICQFTAWLILIGGPVAMAFGGVVKDDLLNDDDDDACDLIYIKDASDPWDDGSYIAGRPGRYHAQCRLLLTWTYIVTVAGSISIVRAFIEVIRPYQFYGYLSPAFIYAMRTFFSVIVRLRYLAGAIILGRSPLIIGPASNEGIRALYSLCLAAICGSAVVSAHQAFSTGESSWRLRGWKRYSCIPSWKVGIYIGFQ
ncbi:hypothetical protein VE03_09192 [Pseudogymnoascus sp. 23342-1-I1]|nr:hypothetical protein VE03_09192 [Pseudogymnoascus sp. 23342-1-I1]